MQECVKLEDLQNRKSLPYFTGEEMVATEVNVSQLLVLVWGLRECRSWLTHLNCQCNLEEGAAWKRRDLPWSLC